MKIIFVTEIRAVETCENVITGGKFRGSRI
jgi:hypothetical protein